MLPVASWYKRQADKGRVLNYGAAANWAFARIGAMTGSNAESSLEAFGDAMRDRRWIDNVASDAEVAGILDRLASGLNEGGIGIGILNAYAPGAGVQELTAVCQLAAAHNVPTFTHVAYMSRIDPESAAEAYIRLIGYAGATGAHMHICHFNSLQQDRHRALHGADQEGAGAGPADHGGGLSLRHRLDGAGGGLLQRSRVRGAQRPRLRFRAARHRRPALSRSRGTAGGAEGGALDAGAVACARHREQCAPSRPARHGGALSRRRDRLRRDAVDAAGRQGLHRRRLAAAGRCHLASALGRLLHPLHPRMGARAADDVA